MADKRSKTTTTATKSGSDVSVDQGGSRGRIGRPPGKSRTSDSDRGAGASGRGRGDGRSRSNNGTRSVSGGRGGGKGRGVKVGRADEERVQGLVADRCTRVKEIVESMEAEKLRRLVLKLVEREPGLVFDLCEEDGSSPPPTPPHNSKGYPSWCKCGNCVRMVTDLEDKCCGCQPQNCVSQRDQMDRLCLDPEVLALGQAYHRDMLGRHRQREVNYNRAMRHSGYRNFTLSRHGRLGAGIRRVIPSCCIIRIRDSYPSPTGLYTGFIPNRYV